MDGQYYAILHQQPWEPISEQTIWSCILVTLHSL